MIHAYDDLVFMHYVYLAFGYFLIIVFLFGLVIWLGISINNESLLFDTSYTTFFYVYTVLFLINNLYNGSTARDLAAVDLNEKVQYA